MTNWSPLMQFIQYCSLRGSLLCFEMLLVKSGKCLFHLPVVLSPLYLEKLLAKFARFVATEYRIHKKQMKWIKNMNFSLYIKQSEP